jgi:hypothetical protein
VPLHTCNFKVVYLWFDRTTDKPISSFAKSDTLSDLRQKRKEKG